MLEIKNLRKFLVFSVISRYIKYTFEVWFSFKCRNLVNCFCTLKLENFFDIVLIFIGGVINAENRSSEFCLVNFHVERFEQCILVYETDKFIF